MLRHGLSADRTDLFRYGRSCLPVECNLLNRRMSVGTADTDASCADCTRRNGGNVFLACGGNKTEVLLSSFKAKVIVLPRQARDNHRATLKRTTLPFAQAPQFMAKLPTGLFSGWLLNAYVPQCNSCMDNQGHYCDTQPTVGELYKTRNGA